MGKRSRTGRAWRPRGAARRRWKAAGELGEEAPVHGAAVCTRGEGDRKPARANAMVSERTLSGRLQVRSPWRRRRETGNHGESEHSEHDRETVAFVCPSRIQPPVL